MLNGLHKLVIYGYIAVYMVTCGSAAHLYNANCGIHNMHGIA